MFRSCLFPALAVACLAAGCQPPAPVAPANLPAADAPATPVTEGEAAAPRVALTELNVHAADGTQAIVGARVEVLELVSGKALPMVATPTLAGMGVVGASADALVTDANGDCRLVLAGVPAGTLLKLVVSQGQRQMADAFQLGVDGSSRLTPKAYAVLEAASIAQRMENLNRAQQAVAALEATAEALARQVAEQDALIGAEPPSESRRQKAQQAKDEFVARQQANDQKLADARAARQVAVDALAGQPTPTPSGAPTPEPSLTRVIDLISTLQADLVAAALEPLPRLTGSAGTQLVNETMAAIAPVMRELRDKVSAQPALWRATNSSGNALAALVNQAGVTAPLQTALSAVAQARQSVLAKPGNLAPGAEGPAAPGASSDAGVLRVPVLNVAVRVTPSGTVTLTNATTGRQTALTNPVTLGTADGRHSSGGGSTGGGSTTPTIGVDLEGGFY